MGTGHGKASDNVAADPPPPEEQEPTPGGMIHHRCLVCFAALTVTATAEAVVVIACLLQAQVMQCTARTDDGCQMRLVRERPVEL